jgi:mono/diheme cytochrome c family protein
MSDITFSTGVQPILNTYCVTCHYKNAPTSVGGGISLALYDDVYVYAMNGQLQSAIEHTAGTYMPKTGGKLSDCNIAIIDAWITADALNN